MLYTPCHPRHTANLVTICGYAGRTPTDNKEDEHGKRSRSIQRNLGGCDKRNAGHRWFSQVAGERESCLEHGVDDFMTKPISLKTIKEKLAPWVVKMTA
jgi:CheY-like chemotaxis protein